MKNNRKEDVPVLLIFFNRPDTFERVFEAVRKARPSRLYLAQDGPRENNAEDVADAEKCRQIAENIDWECDVRKKYSDVNLGCGRGPESAISWAFETTDRLIILEDDCVPDLSFFGYCSELLEKYANDKRISYISGLNHFESWDCGGNSYLFAKSGAIWGWATWRDEWLQNDYGMSSFDTEYVKKMLKYSIRDRYAYNDRLLAWEKAFLSQNTAEKLSYWDMQWGFVKYSQNKLVIIPEKNLITNIGMGEKSTHFQKIRKSVYKRGKSVADIPSHSLDLPLIHPKVMICDEGYDGAVYKLLRPSFVTRLKMLIYKIVKSRRCD